MRVKKALAIGIAGGVSLLALAMAAPGESVRSAARPRALRFRRPAARSARSRLPCAIRDSLPNWPGAGEAAAFQFTPATTRAERNRAVRVAVRVRPGRRHGAAAPPGGARHGRRHARDAVRARRLRPSTYNLGVAVGWRRFAITGESTSSSGGAATGAANRRESPSITAPRRA
jgi:hypothetical protein